MWQHIILNLLRPDIQVGLDNAPRARFHCPRLGCGLRWFLVRKGLHEGTAAGETRNVNLTVSTAKLKWILLYTLPLADLLFSLILRRP